MEVMTSEVKYLDVTAENLNVTIHQKTNSALGLCILLEESKPRRAYYKIDFLRRKEEENTALYKQNVSGVIAFTKCNNMSGAKLNLLN